MTRASTESPPGAGTRLTEPAAGAARARLRVEGLDVRSPSGAGLLRGVACTLESGGWLQVEGPSGIGKSTFLRTLVGLAAIPAPGSVRLEEITEDAGDASAAERVGYFAGQRGWPRWRRTISYVGQAPAFQDASVQDLLAQPSRYAVARERAEPAFDPARARAALERLNVGHVWEQDARSLSGGEAQRVHLVRGLLHQPRFALLDEPTSALDPLNVAALLRWLAELRTAGVGMMVVTHDPRLADPETLRELGGGEVVDLGRFLDPARSSFRLDGGSSDTSADAEAPR